MFVLDLFRDACPDGPKEESPRRKAFGWSQNCGLYTYHCSDRCEFFFLLITVNNCTSHWMLATCQHQADRDVMYSFFNFVNKETQYAWVICPGLYSLGSPGSGLNMSVPGEQMLPLLFHIFVLRFPVSSLWARLPYGAELPWAASKRKLIRLDLSVEKFIIWCC